MPAVRAVLAQRRRHEPGGEDEQRRLPEMVRQEGNHRAPPDFTFFRFVGFVRFVRFVGFFRFFRFSWLLTIFSSSRTSSRVSFPASASCAIIGCALPPKKLRISSSSRCRATSRATVGSKMCALPIFRTRRRAFFTSIRYTVVWMVV